MLQSSLIAIIALIGIANVLRAQERPIPIPPLSAGQKNGGISVLELPTRPDGRYAFVCGFIPTTAEQSIRDSLPYDWIEIEWTVPGQLYKNVPTVHHRLSLEPQWSDILHFRIIRK